MNPKITEILKDAVKIGDEKLRNDFMRKELELIKDEITPQDLEDLFQDAEKNIADIEKELSIS